MSWLDSILGSNAFKAIFPVQGLAQGATQALTGMKPSTQYATGALGGTGIAGLGALGGMTPYVPTSMPNMGAAGMSTGPGGMFSLLNPMGSSMGSSVPSTLSTALKFARMMPQQQQQPEQNAAMQRQQHEQTMRLIYTMFPHLKPGGVY